MLKSTIFKLIISILLAISSIAVYFYAIVYVGNMGSDLGAMYRKSGELNKEEESLNSIKRVAQNADQKNAEISQYVVPVQNEGSIKFVEMIEDTAGYYNLKLNTNSIEIVADGELEKINKEYLSVKISLSGPEYSIANFVKKIESLPYNTKIENYSLTNINSVVSNSTTTNRSLNNNQQLDCNIMVVKDK